ncbi:MAG: MOSC N-terminal beta barrel domain-containing protein [Actinomycetota bacterium]
MRVLELWRYPIKSIGGERLESAEITDLGVAGDRGWGLVDESTGLVLTARRAPALLMATGRLVDGEPVTTTDAGVELRTSADYSDWLGMPVRLERAGDEGGTYENPMDVDNDADWISWQGPAGAWHDSGRARVSIVSTASLRDWDFRRFRSNILVDGAGEDDLVGGKVTIGGSTLTVTKGIDRCVMVTRPQPGLERDLSVLKTILKSDVTTLCIGATVDVAGVVKAGDEVVATTP